MVKKKKTIFYDLNFLYLLTNDKIQNVNWNKEGESFVAYPSALYSSVRHCLHVRV